MSLYFFDSNACGSGITGGPLTWRGDCHTYDAEASVGTLGSEKQYVDPDGDGKVDVSGGFHDAGDHIKFNITIGFGMNALALSEYLNPGIYKKGAQRGCTVIEIQPDGTFDYHAENYYQSKYISQYEKEPVTMQEVTYAAVEQ